MYSLLKASHSVFKQSLQTSISRAVRGIASNFEVDKDHVAADHATGIVRETENVPALEDQCTIHHDVIMTQRTELVRKGLWRWDWTYPDHGLPGLVSNILTRVNHPPVGFDMARANECAWARSDMEYFSAVVQELKAQAKKGWAGVSLTCFKGPCYDVGTCTHPKPTSYCPFDNHDDARESQPSAH